MKYPKLFSPIALSPACVLKNRIVKTGQSTWRWNQDGSAQDSAGEDLYENIARGGAAAVIIGGCAIRRASTSVCGTTSSSRACAIWRTRYTSTTAGSSRSSIIQDPQHGLVSARFPYPPLLSDLMKFP